MAVPARQIGPRAPSRPRPAPSPRPTSGRARAAQRRASRRTVPFLLLFLVVTAVMVTGLVAVQALVAQGAFRIHELTERVERLRSGYERLVVRHAELTEPGRIEDWAGRAGLVRRDGLQVLPVPGGQPAPTGGPAVARGAGG